jgi:hypothetical protein
MRRMEGCYISTHEDSIMKPTKHCSIKGGGGREGIEI